MSRWTENFEAHGVHQQIKRVLEAADLLQPDEPALVPYIDEVARLKKVIAYVSQAINGIDPELLPLTFWDFIRDQLSGCADQISAYLTSKNVAHVQKANTLLDGVLSHIRPYILAKGRLGPALQAAAKSYSSALLDAQMSLVEEVASARKQIEADKNETAALKAQASESAIAIQSKYAELFADPRGEGAAMFKLEQHMAEIKRFHDELVGGEGVETTIRHEIAQAQSAIKESQESVEQSAANAATTIKELTAFEIRILGSSNDDGSRSGGLSAELDGRLKTLGGVEDQQKRRYAALNEQIESLLPGATSAGLASAYKEMRDSFSGPIKNANRLFYASVIALVVISLLLNVEEVGMWSLKFVNLSDWQSVLRSLAYKLPFYAPVVWLAYYASKRRSEFQRLEQEYAHKEALAKSYESYRRQIVELGAESDELMRDLLARAVGAIAFNASESLDRKHGDKVPLHEAFEKAFSAAAKHREGEAV